MRKAGCGGMSTAFYRQRWDKPVSLYEAYLVYQGQEIITAGAD